jgi:hypothetical protein
LSGVSIKSKSTFDDLYRLVVAGLCFQVNNQADTITQQRYWLTFVWIERSD